MRKETVGKDQEMGFHCEVCEYMNFLLSYWCVPSARIVHAREASDVRAVRCEASLVRTTVGIGDGLCHAVGQRGACKDVAYLLFSLLRQHIFSMSIPPLLVPINGSTYLNLSRTCAVAHCASNARVRIRSIVANIANTKGKRGVSETREREEGTA